jgi:hypothetical protein
VAWPGLTGELVGRCYGAKTRHGYTKMERGFPRSSPRSLVAGAMMRKGRRWGRTNGGGKARCEGDSGAEE